MSGSVWDFFSDVYILNQLERPDRWMQVQREMSRIGLDKYFQFLSLPADPPMKSFCISQHAMLDSFVREGGNTFLALEDDVKIDNLNYLEYAIDELRQQMADWDILYLGCNLRGTRPEDFSPHLKRVKCAWMTHAVAYSRNMAAHIVKNYDPGTGQMYDDWLSVNILPKFSCYTMAPMIASQRRVFSNLWGAEVDYSETIIQGNKLMGYE